MMRRFYVIFMLVLFLVSCGYRQVGWDELAEGGSTSSIPSVAPTDGSEEDTDPWSVADEDDVDSGGSDKPSDGGGKGDGGIGGENGGEEDKPSDGNDSGGDNSAAGEDAGETKPGSPEADASADVRLKFSLSAKDAKNKRTYIKSAGTLKAGGKAIAAEITKKAGDVSSFYGVVLYLRDNSEFAGFLISSSGNILIGKMKDGKWNEIKRIGGSEHMTKGLIQKNSLEVKIEKENLLLSVNSNDIYRISFSDLDDIRANTLYGIMAVSSGAGISENIVFDIRQM